MRKRYGKRVYFAARERYFSGEGKRLEIKENTGEVV